MKPLYQIVILGAPSTEQRTELKNILAEHASLLNLRLGEELQLIENPRYFKPHGFCLAAAVYFGALQRPETDLTDLIQAGVMVLPVVQSLKDVGTHLPETLNSLNSLSYDEAGASRVATALLECLGLLPTQRRVFLSYRRAESRIAALQLFEALSARHFDVFLDTHRVPLAADFQEVLWDKLCESDVLLMLDTPSYFKSRWTSAELGRALAKGISVLRIAWPHVHTYSAAIATSYTVDLLPNDLDASGTLASGKIQEIAVLLERVRAKSNAARHMNLLSRLRSDCEKIGGRFVGTGFKRVVQLKLASGQEVTAVVTVGVPSSQTLHDAVTVSNRTPVAVVYDQIGMSKKIATHLVWLAQQVQLVRLIPSEELSWVLADWNGGEK